MLVWIIFPGGSRYVAIDYSAPKKSSRFFQNTATLQGVIGSPWNFDMTWPQASSLQRCSSTQSCHFTSGIRSWTWKQSISNPTISPKVIIGRRNFYGGLEIGSRPQNNKTLVVKKFGWIMGVARNYPVFTIFTPSFASITIFCHNHYEAVYNWRCSTESCMKRFISLTLGRNRIAILAP